MLFNSLSFCLFFSLVFVLYWFIVRKLRWQNLLLLFASYFFYACWDWRFLSLILFSTLVDFFVAKAIALEHRQRKKRYLLYISLFVNLGLLGYFKYANFFLDSLMSLGESLGFTCHYSSLSIILPVGISFYTFQTMSYTIDVYRGRIKATEDFVAFSTFVAFFPQLVAGPIERASNLLPQFFRSRVFTYEKAVDGMRLILWGLFKKVVIADNASLIVDEIFRNYTDYSGLTLIVGAIFFSFQIYGDFSGYSDVAIGVAQLLGFDLQRNFATPYFSRNISEFWKRWHISLTSWFKDYVYIPLGGNRGGRIFIMRNIALVFFLSALWHGANYTFLFWGLIHTALFIPIYFAQGSKLTNVVAQGRQLFSLKELAQMLITFFFVTLAWVFFRAENLTIAFDYVCRSFSKFSFHLAHITNMRKLMLAFAFLLLIEWWGRERNHSLEHLQHYLKPVALRWAFYLLLTILIIMSSGQEQQFIYFQF